MSDLPKQVPMLFPLYVPSGEGKLWRSHGNLQSGHPGPALERVLCPRSERTPVVLQEMREAIQVPVYLVRPRRTRARLQSLARA